MGKDLNARTREFSLRIIPLCVSLPSNRLGDVGGRQLLKAGTSAGAYFRESLRARSKGEYVAKLNGGLMELEETFYWLELVEGAQLVSSEKPHALEQETNELIAIFVS